MTLPWIGLDILANSYGRPIIDLPQRIADRRINLDTFLAEDGVHLSKEGTQLYAQMVFDALKPVIVKCF